jgi:hypothetical protein
MVWRLTEEIIQRLRAHATSFSPVQNRTFTTVKKFSPIKSLGLGTENSITRGKLRKAIPQSRRLKNTIVSRKRAVALTHLNQ